MKKKICLIFSLLLILISSLSSLVYGADTHLNDISIHTTLNNDGSAHVQEIWDINIEEGTEIYKVFDNMGDSHISNFNVVDDQGKRYQNIGEWDVDLDKEDKDGKCGVIQDGDRYELCFGIGEYGRRTYTFEYDIANFVQQYQDTQGFNYAFFSEMELEPQHVKITVSSSHDFNKNNAKIWAFGYQGVVYFDHGDVIMETQSAVPEGAKMQLLMQIDNETFTNAHVNDQSFQKILEDAIDGSEYEDEFYDQGDYYNSFMYKDNTAMIIAIVFAVIGLIGAVVVVLIVAYTRGRVDFQFNDHIPLNHEPPMFRDIPCQKDLFQFYYYAKKLGLISDQDRDGLIAAILLRWIKENYIEFQKEEVKQFLFFKKEGYSVDLDQDIPITHPLEKKLFQFFRQAAGSNQVLETDEFESWCKENYEKIDEWFESIDEYIENELREQHLLTLETTYTSFLKIRFSHSTDTYDASIREEMEHIIGLKTFLEEMSMIDEKEVIEVKLWEEYLIFASILQIADKVQEQLGRLCPTFNEQSQLDTIYTMHMVHMFSHNSMKASHDASIAASGGGGSSSFTGGGGGFSGGGGGGVR